MAKPTLQSLFNQKPVGSSGAKPELNQLFNDKNTQTPTPQPTDKTSFLKGEITGQPQKTGFFGSLFQETLGSKGVAGFVQNVAKTHSQGAILKESSALNESLGNLAKMTTDAIKKLRTMTDPNAKARLQKLIDSNVQTLKDAGADVSALEKQVVTPGQMAATTLRTIATLAPVGKGLSVAQRIGVGGAQGLAYGASTPIEQGANATEVAKGAAIGGITGLGTSAILEGIGAGLRKFANSEKIQKRTASTYNKELQPPVKDVSADIQNGFKTFGEQVANVTDEAGNPTYIGTYNQLLNKSKEELSTKGPQLESLIKQFDKTNPTTFNQGDIAQDIADQMSAIYGQLDKSQINKIKFEVSRMPKKMNLWSIEEVKRMYDKLIPQSFWDKLSLGDEASSFPSYVKYFLRNNARKVINETTNNPLIQKLNNELGVAMDVRGLAARQLAQRQLQKISGSGGFFYKLIGRFIDDYIFNPAITTRLSRGVKALGANTGQTLTRESGRIGLIKGIQQILQPKIQNQ
jgi:hypothetical protein